MELGFRGGAFIAKIVKGNARMHIGFRGQEGPNFYWNKSVITLFPATGGNRTWSPRDAFGNCDPKYAIVGRAI